MMLYLVLIGIFVFEQIVFKSLTFGFSFDISLIYHILLSILPATIATIICSVFKKKINKILLYLITFIICFLTAAQYIYYCIYASPFSFYSLTQGGAGQALDFIPTILSIMGNNMWFILFFLPIFVVIALFKKDKLHFDINKAFLALYLGIALVIFVFSMFCINIDDKTVDSSHEIYYYSDNLLLRSNKFGLYTGIMLDLKDTLFPSSNMPTLNLFDEVDKFPSSNNKGYKNSLDVSFKKSDDDIVNELNNYISNLPATNKNTYTASLKGNNLILIMAESFSPYIIDKNLTPTLYKLANEGLNFTNFYSPLFPVSTSDGEYMALTGLVPLSNTWSLTNSSIKYMKFTLANMLKDIGYSTYAYHDNIKEYYSRFKAIPNLGFEKFTACPDLNITCNIWPQSDVEMINATVSDYVSNPNFFVYYESVSGHLPYTKKSAMFNKNYKYVKNLKYSDTIKYYYACQIELDRALERLLSALDKQGILDNTTIAIFSDHYPYGMSSSEIRNLAGMNVNNKFDISKGGFMIWNKNLRAKDVNVLASNIDITPTLANMYGLSYDSRLMVGKDIFSDTDKIVMMSDQSFITDYVKFNNLTNSYKLVNTKSKVDSSYVAKTKILVSNKFKISTAIFDKDYYSILFK